MISTLCRTLPNASIALRLLKQIATKYPDIILQGLALGLEEASRFQAALSKLAGSQAFPGAQRSALIGFKRLYLEVLHSSKAARGSFLAALTKRFEAACDLSNPEIEDLRLLHLCVQIASCLPLSKTYELMALLRPMNTIISRYGDTILVAIKQAISEGASAKLRTACTAMVYLILLYNRLILKFNMTRDRLAALNEATAERRRLEDNRDLPAMAEVGERLTEADNLELKGLLEQYSGLKILLHTFGECHNFAPVPTDDSQSPRTDGEPSTSPLGEKTPLWALDSTELARVGSGKLLKRKNSCNSSRGAKRPASNRRKSNLSRPPGRRRKSGNKSTSDESDFNEQDEDLEAHFVKRAARPRRRLEQVLDDQ